MLVIVTGNICAGKSTLVKCLEKLGYQRVVEYTTRLPREGEKDGTDYHFTDDDAFDGMAERGEFAETLCVDTACGVWKYGARTEDLKGACVLACGPGQACRMICSSVDALLILLDVDRDTAMSRAFARGDDMDEAKRRFAADAPSVGQFREHADLVLDGRDPAADNAKLVNRLWAARTGRGYMGVVEGQPVVTAQEMCEGELNLYLSGSGGLVPYLRLRERGMPKDPLNQVAWLLLNGSGCGFCKVCRKEPCGIKDGEQCTHNIADYIRGLVHAEDERRENENE